jgi:hypothetical protein
MDGWGEPLASRLITRLRPLSFFGGFGKLFGRTMILFAALLCCLVVRWPARS